MNKILIVVGALFVAVVLFFVIRFVMMGKQSSEMRMVSSVENGHLKPCGEKPNCVCSQNEDSKHKVEPFPVKENWENSKNYLLRVCEELGGSPVEVAPNYLHFEFRSKIFKFVDDVEFYYSDGAQTIEVRSASRVGYSDMGANRKRVERIREKFVK